MKIRKKIEIRKKFENNIIYEKLKEMPPEQIIQLLCIIGIGLGQFASSIKGEPDHYAKLYAQAAGNIVNGVTKPFFTNMAIPISAFFGGAADTLNSIPDELKLSVDAGLPKAKIGNGNNIPDWVPILGKW